jgi:internalin A
MNNRNRWIAISLVGVQLVVRAAAQPQAPLPFLKACESFYGKSAVPTQLSVTSSPTAVNALKRTVDSMIVADIALVGIMDDKGTCELHDRILRKIRGLDLSSIGLSDIRPLSSLTNLEELTLDNNNIVDISPLASLNKLTSLDLSGNKIRQLKPLSSLSQLLQLRIAGNELRDLTPLAQLSALRIAYLQQNQITDIGPLTQLKQLRALWIQNNEIKDIGSVSVAPELSVLDLNGNKVNTIKGVAFTHPLQLDLSNVRVRLTPPFLFPKNVVNCFHE